MSENKTTEVDSEVLEELAGSETGARHTKGIALMVMLVVPFVWSVLQVFYGGRLFEEMGISWINSGIARVVHLSFALFLAFLYFPARKNSPRDRIPMLDWALAFAAVFCSMYLIIFREELVMRMGAPSTMDAIVGVSGLLLLLEGTRRALGPPLMVVAGVFLAYSIFGPYMPDVIAHRGASINKLVSHQWFTSEGVFGVAIGVSVSFVFLFVLFGSLLDKAGAGNYFIKIAFSLLGHMRGGPAKASVVASGLSGIVSGSSIANVVTTGTFTIPLMKRVGFPGTKAGAVEVAASTNGQLMPPFMGAAAFLMVEYVGIPYIDVIRHAFLPAVISYIALFYIVHLEAVKANMQGLPKRHQKTKVQAMLSFLTVWIGISLMAFAVYYGIGWTRQFMGPAAPFIVFAFVIGSYVALVWYASKFPPLEIDDPNSETMEIPETGPTVKAGLYFLLPVALLVWCLLVERLSPGLSAFWAVLFMIFIVLTHRPLMAFFRNASDVMDAAKEGVNDFVDGFINGARNMIGIGVATAAAGIVVGSVTLTGIGQVMTELVEIISGGNLLLMLFFTAIICIILGLGLPTTANYIVVSSLMAPVIVTLGAENGLIVPLIAVHLFVFYFGILADDTPPVGLAAFAAAAISRSDPIRTGVQGFTYDIRTAILPFMFIFNTQLLLIGIESIFDLLMTILTAIGAMLIFSAATQGFWFVRNRWYETVLLLLCTFALFRPDFFWDRIYPPLNILPGESVVEVAQSLEEGDQLTIQASGMTIEGDEVTRVVALSITEEIAAKQDRLQALGVILMQEDHRTVLDMPPFGSPAQMAGLEWDWEILNVQTPAERPSKYWAHIPTILLLALMAWIQFRRRAVESGNEAPATKEEGSHV